jgi:hypothetical protein
MADTCSFEIVVLYEDELIAAARALRKLEAMSQADSEPDHEAYQAAVQTAIQACYAALYHAGLDTGEPKHVTVASKSVFKRPEIIEV